MRDALKRLAGLMSDCLILPVLLSFWLSRGLCGEARSFPGHSQLMSLLPGLAGVYLRQAFYRRVLRRCDSGCSLGFGTVFSHPTAEIGKDVYIGLFCSIGSVTLEDDVLVSSHVSIMNGGAQHGIDRLDIPIREQPGRWDRITIGRDSWIGEHSVVMADVGKHCVIGAGSVVTRPIPDYAIAVGVPARVIRYRDGGDENQSASYPDHRVSAT